MAVEEQAIAEFAMISTLAHLQNTGIGKWQPPSNDNECRFRFLCSSAISEMILFGRNENNAIFIALPESLNSLMLTSNMKVFLGESQLILWSLAVNKEIEVSFPMDSLLIKTCQSELDIAMKEHSSIQICTYDRSRSADFAIKSSREYPLFLNH